MPAPRLERCENPLLKLRSILGNGPKPMHQVDFAQLTGISAATLRAIEAGRSAITRLSPMRTRKILSLRQGVSMRLLCAHWNFLRLSHLANGSSFFGG